MAVASRFVSALAEIVIASLAVTPLPAVFSFDSSPTPAVDEPEVFATMTEPFTAPSATEAPATLASSVRSLSEVTVTLFAWIPREAPISADTSLLSFQVATVPCPETPPETDAPVMI